MITRHDVTSILGSQMDEAIIKGIIKIASTTSEFEETLQWVYADDAMMRSQHHQPHGVVAEICQILSRLDLEPDRE